VSRPSRARIPSMSTRRCQVPGGGQYPPQGQSCVFLPPLQIPAPPHCGPLPFRRPGTLSPRSTFYPCRLEADHHILYSPRSESGKHGARDPISRSDSLAAPGLLRALAPARAVPLYTSLSLSSRATPPEAAPASSAPLPPAASPSAGTSTVRSGASAPAPRSRSSAAACFRSRTAPGTIGSARCLAGSAAITRRSRSRASASTGSPPCRSPAPAGPPRSGTAWAPAPPARRSACGS